MASLGMNDVKTGQKILVNNEPCIITETDYVKPGKGQAFTRVRYRIIRSGRVQEMTMKSTDSVEAADVVDTDMQYLYSDGELYYFMDQETFEQVPLMEEQVEDAIKYLRENDEATIKFYKGSAFLVEAPNFVTLKVVETEPGVKGDTATNVTKAATVETGAIIQVPIFIEEGETIQIDTRTGEYLGRAK